MLAAGETGDEARRPFSRDSARRAAVARIAAVLDERMKQEGITSVRGIADRVGMSWKPIDKLLNGDPDPQLATLLQLAHALELRSIEELLGPFETTRVIEVGRGLRLDR